MSRSREQDERTLHMIALRAAGKSCGEVAKLVGSASGNVSRVTNGVMDADAAYVGRDLSAEYWERRA
ncbi:hypothetical protein [Maritimibacter sp. UBA3975]|uniref:hypothetical protein n=1 Tax=Maritimibacter sp. UBA3975 TaxID=1946833 RepID=UPI0025C5946F|nr:hypothetical protein [Maritimibacter sp. UBA3975]